MWRKRKSIAPSFRLTNPTNPVTGEANYLHPPLKPYARFKLLEHLTTTDESVLAELTDPEQWGPGITHCPAVHVHVHNLLAKDDTTYVHEGEIDDVGFCVHDQNNHWRIVGIVASVGLVGGCLAENHPGRSTAFDIYLGTWNPATDAWDYDLEGTVKAIDHRYDVPFPDAGATGLFQARASDTYGTIYEVVSLDCSSPGACS